MKGKEIKAAHYPRGCPIPQLIPGGEFRCHNGNSNKGETQDSKIIRIKI